MCVYCEVVVLFIMVSSDLNEIENWTDRFTGLYPFTNKQLQNRTQFDCAKAKNNMSSDFQCSESIIYRTLRIGNDDNEQEIEVSSSEESSCIGLRLRKTPSLIELVNETIQESKRNCSDYDEGYQYQYQSNMHDFVSQPIEKLKAPNFPAMFLKIGSWETHAKCEGDLVAKIYYGREKLVWEIWETTLKSKIEIQWCDIIGIRATIHDEEPGILEIELEQPPLFYQETNPEPRRHTLWKKVADFTQGQASIYRGHSLKFPPGTLDKHYKKLLQWDPRLFQLSRKPFPSEESPHFFSDIYEISRNFNGRGPETPLPFVPPHLFHNFKPTPTQTHVESKHAPMPVMEFPSTYGNPNNYEFENQSMTLWAQGGNHNASGDQFQGLPFSPQNYQQINYEMPNPYPRNGMLGDNEDHLLSDSQIVSADGINLTTRLSSMGPLLEPFEEPNINNNIGVNFFEPKHIEQCIGHDKSYLSTTGSFRVEGDPFYQMPIECIPPQLSNENLMMNLQGGNSLYPFSFSNSTVGNFAAVDTEMISRQWT